eukprot:UN2215
MRDPMGVFGGYIDASDACACSATASVDIARALLGTAGHGSKQPATKKTAPASTSSKLRTPCASTFE